uniref:GrpE protein homolog n=1 Tax=Glossina palpalis gambiensis TaxID=67801 RepID=A0A1B0C4X9_9MUSC
MDEINSFNAELGSKSVKNPKFPILIPIIFTEYTDNIFAACKILPSPPTIITKSDILPISKILPDKTHQAEIENTLKRTQINIEKSHKFALEKFAIALLPIIDNLERTLEISSSLNENVNPILEGVQLTLKEFIKVMKLFNIICIDKNHVEFDPKVHEAMTVLDSKEFKSNQVIQVMQKGYMLHAKPVASITISTFKSFQGVEIQYPPDAAVPPIEMITGLPIARVAASSARITSEAFTLPPGLYIIYI